MNLDFIPPTWRQHLINSDSQLGTVQISRNTIGTSDYPLDTLAPVPNRRELGPGILRVQVCSLGITTGNDWLFALFDGEGINTGDGDTPTDECLLQLGTADGDYTTTPPAVFLHLTSGQLNRLAYWADNQTGNCFSFLLDYWTYEDIEAAIARWNGRPAPAQKGCGC